MILVDVVKETWEKGKAWGDDWRMMHKLGKAQKDFQRSLRMQLSLKSCCAMALNYMVMQYPSGYSIF